MAVKLGYKQTQVGVIPSDWAIQSLGNVADLKSGFAFPSKSYSAHGQFKIITISNVHDGSFESLSCNRIDSVPAAVQSHHILNVNDILISMTGYVGRACIVTDIHCLLNQRVGKLVPRTILHQFLYVLLRNPGFMSSMSASAKGAAQGNLSVSDVLDYRFPLPPLHEQRAIATALTDVDDLLTSLDRLIAKKRAIKQGVMHDLLTGRKRLPGFSGEWEVRRLGDHLRVLRNGVNSRAELQDEGEIRYLHYGDIHGHTTHHLNPANLPFLPTYKAASLDKLSTGDLVFADASEDLMGVGKSVEILPCDDTSVVSGQHTIALRFDKTILADGFKGLLQFVPEFLAHLRRHAAGTKVLATNRAFIMSAEVLLPPPTEQAAIATLISELETEITALQARRDKTHAIKQAMMHELLTGRTRLI